MLRARRRGKTNRVERGRGVDRPTAHFLGAQGPLNRSELNTKRPAGWHTNEFHVNGGASNRRCRLEARALRPNTPPACWRAAIHLRCSFGGEPGTQPWRCKPREAKCSRSWFPLGLPETPACARAARTVEGLHVCLSTRRLAGPQPPLTARPARHCLKARRQMNDNSRRLAVRARQKSHVV